MTSETKTKEEAAQSTNGLNPLQTQVQESLERRGYPYIRILRASLHQEIMNPEKGILTYDFVEEWINEMHAQGYVLKQAFNHGDEPRQELGTTVGQMTFILTKA